VCTMLWLIVYLIDCPISEIKLAELFTGANEEAWYWLLNVLQMANHNISIAIRGLHNAVQVSSSERNKHISSICNSYIVSNGLHVDGIAKGMYVLCVYSLCACVCACVCLCVCACARVCACMCVC